jgi:hypothetical protein
VTKIQNNTVREVFNFLTLKPDCRATMDNSDKYVARINMLAIVKQKESLFLHSTVDNNRVTFLPTTISQTLV